MALQVILRKASLIGDYGQLGNVMHQPKVTMIAIISLNVSNMKSDMKS